MNTVRERESGRNRESGIDVYTLSRVKQTAGEKLLHREPRLVLCDDLEELGGKCKRDIYIVRTDSHFCMAETGTTL